MLRNRVSARRLIIAVLLILVLSAAGCSAPRGSSAEKGSGQGSGISLQEQAAAEATAIIDRARATAIVLQAQAEAEAMLRSTATPEPQAGSVATPSYLIVPTRAPDQLAAGSPEAAGNGDGDAGDVYKVELLGVSYAAEGGFVMVSFHASHKAVSDFWPGRLSITDEATGTVYNEVATMPVIGPLIGRPITMEQTGYVMFVNPPPGLPPGARVTVVLGQFKQEHVEVKADGLESTAVQGQ